MIYLTRPVFTFPINWASPVNKSFAFDLKEQRLGFASEYFATLQKNVVQGFQLTTWLDGNAAIAAFDAFTAALCGRLAGFWLPAPFEGMTITEVSSTTVFNITPQNLAATWQDHPDVYLYFTAPGQTAVAAKILSVTDGGGFETVTVDAAVPWLATAPLDALSVFRLLYVRLAEDVEQGKFIAENSQARALKVIELPEEYAAIETGAQRIYLFSITCDAPMQMTWTYTNFAAPISSLGTVFQPFPMQHKSLRRGKTLDGETLEIEAKYDPNHPFSLWLPVPFPRPMTIEIVETTFADVDDQTTYFYGRVIGVKDTGEKITAQCESFEYLLKYKIPGPYIGPTCPWAVYDPNTCKVLRANFECQATISAIDSAALPPTVSVQFSDAAQGMPGYTNAAGVWVNVPISDLQGFANWTTTDWFAQGLMETGYGTDYELRVIQHSTFDSATSTLTLTLNAELVNAVVGQSIQLVAGCDGAPATCQTKFNNYENNGSFPGVPVVNPSLASFAYYQMQGGKGK